jgi:hypothetical protein
MRKKNKIIIGVTILTVAVLIAIIIVISLDRLEFENYGLNYNEVLANFSETIVYGSGLRMIGPSNYLLPVSKIPRQLSYSKLQAYTNDYFPVEADASVTYTLNLPSNASLQFDFLSEYYINMG